MEKEIRWTFRYNGNHLEDECYMQKMCHQGWAARSLTEGFWKFERCKPDEFCYRIVICGERAGRKLRQSVCRKIFVPMLIGTAVGWLVVLIGVLLALYVSPPGGLSGPHGGDLCGNCYLLWIVL